VIRFPAGAEDSSPLKNGETASRAHPATYSVSTQGLSLGLKRPGREVDLLPQSTAEVKNGVKLYLYVVSWRQYTEAF